MPRVELEQGTEEWLNWRKDKLTASNVAKILEASPYGTPFSLWEEMTGRKSAQKINSAMLRGHTLEPLIREYWTNQVKIGFIPACYTHPEFKYIASSLDGISLEEDVILEIKTCNKDVFALAKDGIIVEHYRIQIQVQLMCVPTAEYCDAVFYNGSDDSVLPENIAHVKVFRDEALQNLIEEKCMRFYFDNFLEDVAPEYCAKDYIYLGDDLDFMCAENTWMEAHNNLKEAIAVEKEARSQLFMSCAERNSEGNFIKVSKVVKKGAIDYKLFLADQGIDISELNVFRKPSPEYLMVTVKK